MNNNNNKMWSKYEISALLEDMRHIGDRKARFFHDPIWDINVLVTAKDGILVDKIAVMYYLIDNDEARFIES